MLTRLQQVVVCGVVGVLVVAVPHSEAQGYVPHEQFLSMAFGGGTTSLTLTEPCVD